MLSAAKRLLCASILLSESALASSFAIDAAVVSNGSRAECSASISNVGECSAVAEVSVLEQILADDYEGMDPSVLPNSIRGLKARGAHRCWHKHSTFLDHLLGVHNILRLWGQGHIIGRVGLFHSAYSNSYVNLALFDPSTERDLMRELIGNQAEDLVYMFCIINRQEVVVNTLLRQGFIPKDGLYLPHLRNPDENVFLSAETLRMLVVFTMADTADQYFGWQDQLFGGGGTEGSMIIPGQDLIVRHDSKAIWPGVSKPGLWMSYISDLGKVARTFDPSWRTSEINDDQTLDVPPVFESGTQTLTVNDEAAARDLYWNVVTGEVNDDDEIVATLQACHAKNPWAFEPLVMLAQKYLHRNDYDAAMEAATRALDLQHQWGTAWDKRLAFGAWVSWTRVMYQRAEERKPWPANSWEVNNFGLVR
jgi:ribulose bisphosphate carboxylase small subunit